MKKYRHILHLVAEYLEIAVAAIITIMVAISVINMIIHIAKNPFEIQDSEGFYNFLSDALSLIVGIEFLKMIIIPTSSNIIETLLFAVSRNVILNHEISMIIVGVVSIAILFIIKKYLFTDFDEIRKTVLRASTKVKTANKLANVNLPVSNPSETLGELYAKRLTEEGRVAHSGSIVEFGEHLALKAEIMGDDGEPEQIEIINEHEVA